MGLDSLIVLTFELKNDHLGFECYGRNGNKITEGAKKGLKGGKTHNQARPSP